MVAAPPRYPLLPTLLLFAACTTPDTGDSTTKTTDSDTAADSGDTDPTGTPDGLFFEGTGTVNGETLTWSCDESSAGYAFYSTVKEAGGVYALGGVCADTTRLYYAQIGARTATTGSSSACVPGQWGVAVLNLATSTSWNCALDGVASIEVAVDELTPDGGASVVWGGSFQATSDGTSMYFEADVSGTFRFEAAPG